MSRIQIFCSTRALSAELGLGVKGIPIILWSLPPYSLVIQYNIWSPDVVGRHVQLLYAPVLVGVPNQFVVVPKLEGRERRRISALTLGARRLESGNKEGEGSAACNRLCLVRPAPCTMHVTPLGRLVGCGAFLFVLWPASSSKQ